MKKQEDKKFEKKEDKKIEKKEDKKIDKKVETKIIKTKFKKKNKERKNISSGIAFVNSTFNNTIISIADEHGNVVSWSSAGSKGFKDTTPLPHNGTRPPKKRRV